jgi:hypothetical protein
MAVLSKRKREFVEHMLCCEETGFTDKEFAERIGVRADTASKYRHDPDVIAAYETALKEQEQTASIFGAKTFIWTLEEAIINYKGAEGADKRLWWKLIRDLTEPMAGSSGRVDYSMWNDADLEAEFTRRGLNETEAAIEAAKGAL